MVVETLPACLDADIHVTIQTNSIRRMSNNTLMRPPHEEPKDTHRLTNCTPMLPLTYRKAQGAHAHGYRC
eukprot:2913975-Amphidinium_carterae.1